MKPDAAMNDLDLAVKEAAEARGYGFLGAEFGQPLTTKPERVELAWHIEIAGKHAKCGVRVPSDQLDEPAIRLYLVQDLAATWDRLASETAA